MKTTYVKTELKNIVNVSKIVTIHYYEFDKNFIFNGEEHDFWEMVYIDKGKVAVCSDNNENILSQGEIIFHKPNEFHSIRAIDSAPNFFVISFVCKSPAMVYFEKYKTILNKTLKPFISSILKEAENTFVIPKNDPLLKKLNKKERAIIGGEQLIKTYLEQLLILLIRDITNQKDIDVFPSKDSLETHLITMAKKYIEDGADKPFRINDLCDYLGYSKSYLSKLFHEQTGTSLAHFSINYKIQKAKQLIRQGDLNFTQISDSLSFDNPQYFSRVFKRITGMTPSEFKNTLSFNN